ncbi:MAG: DUF4390 domain-containing protein [Acidobacteria bacterium]|nr:DUF4390 domain-containing protein [Acidobacteriota bacterium]MCI0568636.1 DUF4390 domain-containing protein [Acidobacteriota bacterium]
MRRILPGLALLIVLTSPVSAAEETPSPDPKSSPSIAGLNVEIRDGLVLASFQLVGALDSETRTRIASGLETTFDYRVELVRRRRFWPDARVRQHRILTSAKFDSLSRQYGLTLKLDGEVERSSTTDRAEEMERWLTGVKEVSLGMASELLPQEEYAVRVKADFPPRFILLFIPWDRDTAWVRGALPPLPVTEHEPHP